MKKSIVTGCFALAVVAGALVFGQNGRPEVYVTFQAKNLPCCRYLAIEGNTLTLSKDEVGQTFFAVTLDGDSYEKKSRLRIWNGNRAVQDWLEGINGLDLKVSTPTDAERSHFLIYGVNLAESLANVRLTFQDEIRDSDLVALRGRAWPKYVSHDASNKIRLFDRVNYDPQVSDPVLWKIKMYSLDRVRALDAEHQEKLKKSAPQYRQGTLPSCPPDC